jgi:hypothetical protein
VLAKDGRTLNAVFEAGGVPYAVHYDPRKTLGGYTQVLKADGLANAGGKVPAAAIVLNSTEYLDCGWRCGFHRRR